MDHKITPEKQHKPNSELARVKVLEAEKEAIEKDYRARFLGELWELLPERDHGYHDIVRYVQDASTAALSPQAKAEEPCEGCDGTGRADDEEAWEPSKPCPYGCTPPPSSAKAEPQEDSK